MLVVITSAGIGKRLSPYTKNLNKGALPFNNQPAIVKIINSYPKDYQFILCVGHQGQNLLNILKFYGLLKKIKICKIDKYDETYGSLTYTLKKALKYINEPFYFHANDSIINKMPNITHENNLIFVNQSKDNNNLYRKIIINKNKKISNFVNKSYKINKKNNYFNYTGVCFIHDYIKFKNLIHKSDSKIGESEFIKKNISTFNYHILNNWVDIGSIESFEKNAYIGHNVLPKPHQQIYINSKFVLKFFEDKNKIKNLILRSKKLKDITPKLNFFSNNLIYYRYIPGQMFNNQKKINLYELLTYFNEKIWTKKINKKIEIIKFQNILLKFYKDKTINRIDSYFKNYSIIDNVSYINKIKVDKVYNLLDRINWGHITSSKQTLMHGDLHFENILISNVGNIFALDIRDDFKNINNFGDVYYDLAKILHGILVSHESVSKNKYKYKNHFNNVEISIKKGKNHIKNINNFYEFCNFYKFDVKKIELICSLIYLNIADLHHFPYSHFLFNLGKLLLMRSINNDNNIQIFISNTKLLT